MIYLRYSFMGFWEPFLQLLVASVLGGVVGVERDIAGKRAGMRTHALVALGAALFVLISTLLTPDIVGTTPYDPIRIAASIVAGVGFIGAGVIIFREERSALRGVTTAAGLWVVAAIGVAVGFKLYAVAAAATVLALLIFRVLWYLEHAIEKRFANPPPGEEE